MLDLPKDIKYIITDFDGVLTDGFIYISDKTEDKTKRVSFKDIMGLSIAVKNGISIAIISGEDHPVIDYISNKFNITEVHKGIRNKYSVVLDISLRNNLDLKNVIYIGDDINDIESLKAVGYPVTVPDANYKVKQIDSIQITAADGGNGAFREVVDSILP